MGRSARIARSATSQCPLDFSPLRRLEGLSRFARVSRATPAKPAWALELGGQGAAPTPMTPGPVAPRMGNASNAMPGARACQPFGSIAAQPAAGEGMYCRGGDLRGD